MSSCIVHRVSKCLSQFTWLFRKEGRSITILTGMLLTTHSPSSTGPSCALPSKGVMASGAAGLRRTCQCCRAASKGSLPRANGRMAFEGEVEMSLDSENSSLLLCSSALVLRPGSTETLKHSRIHQNMFQDSIKWRGIGHCICQRTPSEIASWGIGSLSKAG